MLVDELAKRGCIKIEGLDIDAYLVGPELRGGIKHAGRLGQGGTGRVEHPMQADR